MSSVNVSPGRAVEDDDANRPREADEDVVLAALVVVEPRMTPWRERERFTWRIGFGNADARASSVNQPRSSSCRASSTPLQPVDHRFTPTRTKSFTA